MHAHAHMRVYACFSLAAFTSLKMEWIDNPSGLVFSAYQQALLKTLNTLGLGQKYARVEFPEQVEGLRTHLALMCRMMALTDVARFKHSVSTAMMKIDNDVPCILHLHKLLIEKMISLVMLKSLAEQGEKNLPDFDMLRRCQKF
jgi:hypothetical protein